MESVVSHTAVPVVDQQQDRRQAVVECLARAHYPNRSPAAQARAEYAAVAAWVDSLSYSQSLAVCFAIRAQTDPAYGGLAKRAVHRAIGCMGTPAGPGDLTAAEQPVLTATRRILHRR